MMIKCNHVQVYGVQMSIRHGHIQRAIPSGSPCHAIPYGVTSTVNVAWLLVTLPAELLTITEKHCAVVAKYRHRGGIVSRRSARDACTVFLPLVTQGRRPRGYHTEG